MKQLLLVLFIFSYFCCNAQNRNNESSVLLLSKNGTSNPVELELKPNKPIKIKTTDGRKLTLIHYSILGDSVIVSSMDTVALRNIASLKGKVKGNALRKLGGGLVAGTGYYFVMVGYLVGTIAFYPPAYLIILPSAGIAYAGHYLSGARHFDTTEKWALSINEVE
ncbi:hypothetical protein ABID22_003324 [Pontibacter aydingkolensis]|uniref:Uncharacterized protein n=1 Tax=Pontibacter aydingkolensis TaxID=1911536 RepID=A0ABS7CUA2_9BACT|nr:hypothetical protein [Pontibacter aydingkolensis]MBW7467407.1 hypothetical protein [Pontibacter aydingkolensis]